MPYHIRTYNQPTRSGNAHIYTAIVRYGPAHNCLHRCAVDPRTIPSSLWMSKLHSRHHMHANPWTILGGPDKHVLVFLDNSHHAHVCQSLDDPRTQWLGMGGFRWMFGMAWVSSACGDTQIQWLRMSGSIKTQETIWLGLLMLYTSWWNSQNGLHRLWVHKSSDTRLHVCILLQLPYIVKFPHVIISCDNIFVLWSYPRIFF